MVTDHGSLLEALDAARRLARARRIALAWRAPGGRWQFGVRSRDDMLPQTEQRLSQDLMRLYEATAQRAEGWPRLLADWRAARGDFETFVLPSGTEGCFAVLYEDETRDESAQAHSAWLALVLPVVAGLACESERSGAHWSGTQAVLESAATLWEAATESDALAHGLRVIRRLVDAEAAAYYERSTPAGPLRVRHVDAETDLHDVLERGVPLDADARERLLAGDVRSVVGRGPAELAVSLPGYQLLAIAVRDHDASDALICLVRSDTVPFTELDRATLAMFCRQVAGVRENLRLLNRLQDANRELSQTQAQLVESARLETLGEVAAGVAHDINNVLGAILGRIQLLQHSVREPKVLSALSKMEKTISDGEGVVHRLQEAAQVRTRPDRVQSLDGLVRDVFADCENTLRNRTQIEDRKTVWITEFWPTGQIKDPSGDLRAALRQVLMELSACAPQDSVLELQTRREGNRDTLRIVLVTPDASPGWSWDALPGLTQFHRVVQAQDGSMMLNQESPMEHQLVVYLGVADPEASGIGAMGASRSPMRILIVDDDIEVRDVLEELLHVDGHKVSTAADGAEALSLFKPGRFDMVFTDLGMPGISGWQVVEQIKRQAPQTPVVMVTGWGAQLDPARIAASGVDRVLTKPFQWLAVLEALNDLTVAGTADSGH